LGGSVKQGSSSSSRALGRRPDGSWRRPVREEVAPKEVSRPPGGPGREGGAQACFRGGLSGGL
jgi:hypothetical protein